MWFIEQSEDLIISLKHQTLVGISIISTLHSIECDEGFHLIAELSNLGIQLLFHTDLVI